jgi:hypothetical protein
VVLRGDNWDICDDGLCHPRKWVDDNFAAIDQTEWGKDAKRLTDEQPEELVPRELAETVVTGDVICSRRYSKLPEPLPTPNPPVVVDDRNTLAETWRLKEQQRHSSPRTPVTPPNWVKAEPTEQLDLGEIHPLSW